MSTFYSVVCLDAAGRRLGEVTSFAADGQGAGLEYVLCSAPGGLGVLQVTVPATVSLDLFPKHGRLIPYRAIAGRAPVMDNGKVYLVMRRQIRATSTLITAVDATSILQRRIIAYYAGSSQAAKAAAPAGDQIKAFARQQLIAPLAGGPPDRYGSSVGLDVSAWLSVQADLGDGYSIAKAAAWRNLHDVATEIAQASAANGTYLTFEIVAPTEGTLELRTAVNQRGVDRRASSANPLIFSAATGMIENVELDQDWTTEITSGYAGGAGEGIYRLVRESFSLDASATPFGRSELFADYTNSTDVNEIARNAEALRYTNHARVTLSGDLVETPGATRGIHYDLGDYVTVSHRGVQVDVRLDTIHVQAGLPRDNSAAGDAIDADTARYTADRQRMRAYFRSDAT